MPHALRIGTRGSPLALAQAELVREALERASVRLEFDISASVATVHHHWRQGDGPAAL